MTTFVALATGPKQGERSYACRRLRQTGLEVVVVHAVVKHDQSAEANVSPHAAAHVTSSQIDDILAKTYRLNSISSAAGAGR